MSTKVATEPPHTEPQQRGIGLAGWLRWFWRQLTSMRIALILLFLLAVASIPGSMFPQRGSDPLGVDRYIADNPGPSVWLDRVGLFDVYAAPWFVAIYILLFVSLVGCIVPRTVVYAKALRSPPPKAPSRLLRLNGAQAREVSAGKEQVLDTAATMLKSSRWRVRSGDGWVSAEKGYLREAGNLLFHISLLVLLLAVGVGSLFGWHATVITVEGRGFSNTLTQYDSFTAGRLVDKSSLTPFSVNLEDFRATYHLEGPQRGMPRDFQADLRYRAGMGEPEQNATISVNSPLSVAGAKVFLQGHGFAPEFRVTDATGEVVFDDAVVFLPRDQNFTSTGVVKLPDAQPVQLGLQAIFLPTAVVDPELGPISVFPVPTDPAVFMSAWEGDLGLDSGMPQSVFRLDTTNLTQIGLQSLRPGETWTLDGGQGEVTFVGFKSYASFSVSHDPGEGVALAAAIAAILGLMMSLFIPRRRVWVRVSPGEAGRTLVHVAGLARSESADIETETKDITDRLCDELEEGEGK